MTNQNTSPSLLPIEHRLPLPDVDATTLVRVVTDPLTIETEAEAKKRSQLGMLREPTTWILNRAHPLAGSKIVRMYHREDGGVDVYSSDGDMCVRTHLPERVVRFLDETMSDDTFVAFIEEAETEEEEEEVEPELEPGPEPSPEPEPTQTLQAAANDPPPTA